MTGGSYFRKWVFRGGMLVIGKVRGFFDLNFFYKWEKVFEMGFFFYGWDIGRKFVGGVF